MIDRVQFNLGRVHEAVSAAVPDRDVLVWGPRRFRYADLTERSRRLASYLYAAGVGVREERHHLAGHQSGQEHVALYLYNGNEYLEGMLGAFKARAAPFNVNYRYVEDELRYLFGDAKAKAVVYHATFAPDLARVLPDLPSVEVLLQVADDSDHDLLPGAVDYEAALASAPAELPAVEPSADDLYLLYTGGTTGMPKGVVWRQHDIFLAAMGGRAIGSWEEVGTYEEIAAAALGAPMRLMPLPPLMHGASQWSSFIAMTKGWTLVFPENTRRLDPADVWATVERDGVHSITVVGDAMARPLLEELERGTPVPASLVAIGNGGAPLNASLKERFLALAPDLMISDSAGASETGAQMTHVSTKAGVSTGHFAPSPETMVVNEELDGVVLPGHEGLGWLAQAGAVPLGYLGDPEKTARTFPVIDGVRYAIPGDRARLLVDGTIELLGRDSVTINSGGEKIFAEEVEAAIASHPSVADVIVVGRPSDRWGQEVVAVVQLATSSATATPAELEAHAARHIARYKLPKSWVFVDAVQRSPSGKADYRWAKTHALGSEG
jgi:acyl-CoA synthetase (AMP-forming)/AMP-acid ligase II